MLVHTYVHPPMKMNLADETDSIDEGHENCYSKPIECFDIVCTSEG